MSVRPLRSLLVAAIAMGSLAVPAVVAAKPGYFTFPAERRSVLTVRGSHGFRIGIERSAGRVELTASKGHASAIYIVRSPKLPPDRIEARFPGRGRVSLRFHPWGALQRLPPFCNGRSPIKQAGTFRGAIRFEGEQGFTRVVAAHVRGYVYRSFKEVCRRSDVGHGTVTPGYSLVATARSHGRGILFTAFRSTEESLIHGDTYYTAVMSERRHGMVIGRTALALGRASTFSVEGPNAQPDSATVAPRSPFSGKASFHATAGSTTEWAGTLAVDLPGAGTVQLTGPLFKSELCLNKRCVGQDATGQSASGRSSLRLRSLGDN